MTLNKQIMIAMSMLVLLLLGTAMFVNYKNAERFITDQLISNAENTASSLGVAIANVKGDKAMSETFINAVFDSGYYESIIMSDMDGNVVYQSSAPVKVQGIPSWFIKSIYIAPSEAAVPLSSNWRMIGELKIRGNRGHAYKQIWEAFKEMVTGFLVLGLVALVGIYLFLKMVLLPLKRVREQAEAVIERRFIFQDTLPKTKEMLDVVTAMNLLVKKVKTVYEKEAKAIADYKQLLYHDSETDYYNRAYFRIKMQDYLHASDYYAHGHILAFEIHNYPKLLEEKGVNGVHEAVIKLRDMINENSCSAFNESVRCRTRENDIMIILPSSRKEEIEKTARTICEKYSNEYQLHCAYVSYKEREKLSEILKKIDNALMMSEVTQNASVSIYTDVKDNIPLLSHNEWITEIHKVMDNNAFILMFQPVINAEGETIQNELLLRLKYKGEIISAGKFMPIISSVNMLSELDTYVLNLVDTLPSSKPIAVNITHEFINKSVNLQSISSFTKSWKTLKMEIIFELSNTIITSDPEAAKAFAAHVHKEGWELGIDHYTVGTYDFDLIEKLRPTYVKINATYLLSLIEGREAEATKSSILTLSELLEIDIIAMGVDSQSTATRLRENGIMFMQGFWIAEAKEVGKYE